MDHLCVAIASLGGFLQSPSGVFDDHSWEHCQDLDGNDEGGSRWFVSVPGIPSNCTTSKILEEVILALQQACSGNMWALTTSLPSEEKPDLLTKVSMRSDLPSLNQAWWPHPVDK